MDHTNDESRQIARRLIRQITDGLAEHQRVGRDVFGAVYQEHWDSAIDWEPQNEKSDTSKSYGYSLGSAFEEKRVESLGPRSELIDTMNPGENPSMDRKNMASNVLDGVLLDGTADPIILPLALLQQITENFDDRLKIGQGGFAVVYKGVLQSGCVAVKKLINSHIIEDAPFYRETTFLMSVKHQNIVRFLGYCANTEKEAFKVEGPGKCEKYIYVEIKERLLCFEYLSKGSLDKYTTDELRGFEWHTRYQIIKGICEGLQYLHKEKGIVHMDLKPANILLDDLLVPKITDFGISKYLDGISQAFTVGRQWTLGYCAPEYRERGHVSFKADIFCLGIIITDIVTGRNEDPNIKNILRRWRYRWNKSGNNPPLGYKQVTKCIEIAERCMSYNMKTRPDISDIVNWLNETESRNENIGDAGESSVGPIIKPYSWELLDIDPLELHFPFEINKEISCSLHLTNTRDDFVAFHIELPSTQHYDIVPNRGIVPPQSKINVMVTLQAQKKVPNDMLGKDEFVLRCTVLNDSLKAENISKDMFDGMLEVDEATLTVSF